MNSFISSGGEDLHNLFQARNLAAATRSFPEIRSKDGILIDTMKPNFLMMVCHEMDRNLLRKLKDTQLPPHYVNYKDPNGLVRFFTQINCNLALTLKICLRSDSSGISLFQGRFYPCENVV